MANRDRFDRQGRPIQKAIPEWVFGEPTLTTQGNSKALWERANVLKSSNQKGSTGWVAKLVGGTQASWASAAMVSIPVNEMSINDFKSAQWTYYLENAEEHGVNIGFLIHDPDDFAKRADLNQAQSHADLARAAGWNRHKLNLDTTDMFFYYGENITGSGLTSASTSRYKFNEYQADTIFKTWTIYRIVISYGWYTTGVFDDCYIGEIELNEQVIPLKPSQEEMWYSDHCIKNDIPISTSIYTPRRIHVEPVFANYTSAGQHGIGHLVRGGYGDTGGGIDLGIGYSILLEIGADTAVVPTVAIPLNIPLNKIDTLSYLGKMQEDNVASQNIRGVSFRLDTDRSGAFTHNIAKSDYYLSNNSVTTAGQDDWELITPLTDAFYTLHQWHTGVPTPDGAIGALAASKTFAHFAATDVGDWYVKELLFVLQQTYATPEKGDWAIVASLCINGIEYIFDLADHQRIQHFYIDDTDTSISETLAPRTAFRLLGVDVHTSAALDSGEVLTMTKASGLSNYHNTVLLSEDLFVGTRTSFHATFGKGYEFASDDTIVIAAANGTAVDVGIDVSYEIL